MKRILYSCFLLTFLFLTHNILAQPFTVTMTPQAMCGVAGGVYQNTVGVQVPSPGANISYTFAVAPLGSANLTVVPATAPGVSSVAIVSYTGCGSFTVSIFAFQNGVTLVDQRLLVPVVECPTATITASSNSVCPAAAVSLTAAGTAVTWTWNPGNSVGSVLNVNPIASTCYTVVGTTANGCTVSANKCVTVQPIGVSVSPSSQTVCAGTTITLTAITTPTSGTAIQWYDVTGAPVPLGTASVQTAVVNATANYSVNVAFNTCTASATASVAIDVNLSVQASAASASVCPSETTALTATASALSYTWVAPPSTTLAGNTYSNVAIGPGTYTVYAQNGACMSLPTTVTVLATSFSPTLTPSTTFSVCSGQPFTLTATGGSNAATSYTWGNMPPPPPVISPTPICLSCGDTQTLQQTSSQIYIVGATNAAGCIGTNSVLVGITPPLTITAVQSAGSVCASSAVTITANGIGVSSYTLTGGAGGPVTNTTGIFVDNPISVTVYTVVGSNTAGYCTSAPQTLTVNMVTGGTLTLSVAASVATICPGQSSSLTASGALSFTWSPGATLNTTLGAGVVASPTVPTLYTVVGNNNGGCSGTATVVVDVSPIPTVNIVVTASAVCAGFNSTITASGAASYTWTGSSFSNPVLQSSISVGPGQYTVIGASNANCPSLQATVNIGLAPPLNIVTAQDNFTTCVVRNLPSKLSAPISFTAVGATTYAWFPYNPAYMTYSVGPNTTVRPPTSTCYTVVGATSICTGSAVICVNVIPQFTMQVTPPQPAICLGDSILLTITNIHTLAVGPPSAWTYTWAPNVPITLSDNLGPFTIAWPQVTTTYTVEMKDSRGCVSLPRLVTVTVLPQPLTAVSIPTINGVPTNTVCYVGLDPSAPDVYIDLCAGNVQPGGLPNGVTPTFTWSSPYHPTSIVTSTTDLCARVIAPQRLPAVAVYTVTSGYNGIPGCKRQDTVSVRVIDCRPVNIVKFTTDIGADTVCTRNCITFMALTDTMAGGPQTYTWNFEGGNPATSNEPNPVVCYDLPNKNGWDVVLYVANPYPLYEQPSGSSGSTSKRDFIKVVDVPNVTIIPPGQLASDTVIKFGEQVVLTGTNAIHFSWSPNYNISSLTGSVTTVNPHQTTQYILTGYNSSKCFSSDTINVIVIEDCGEMYVPNAFSPNGDGVNDELRVRGICLETLTFMIFNRWGEKVFESNDIHVGWDGTYHGEKMNTAVFVYRLEGKTYSGKGFSLKGNVTLIR
jgi:gliding motility-associated-like protein